VELRQGTILSKLHSRYEAYVGLNDS